MQQRKKASSIQPLDDQSNSTRRLKCPFNSKHRVQPRVFAGHIEKCKKRLPSEKLNKFVVCRYNSLHIFSIYEIGAHQMTCPNKKRMIDLQKKILNDSQVLQQQSSYQNSNQQSKKKEVYLSELQQSLIEIKPYKQIQKTAKSHQSKGSSIILNFQTQLRKGQQFSRQREQQNDYDRYEPDTNISYYENLNITQAQLKNEGQSVLRQQSDSSEQQQKNHTSYAYKNVQKQKQINKNKQQSIQTINNQKSHEMNYDSGLNNKFNKIIQKQLKIMQKKLRPRMGFIQQKQMKKNQNTSSKHKLNFDQLKQRSLIHNKVQQQSKINSLIAKIKNESVSIKNESKVKQADKNNLKKVNKNQIISNNNLTNIPNKYMQNHKHANNFIQTSLKQCQQCQKILTNPDNKLWRNKKLLKYLKAYYKLQQQQQEIKQFLKYVPRSVKQAQGNTAKQQISYNRISNERKSMKQPIKQNDYAKRQMKIQAYSKESMKMDSKINVKQNEDQQFCVQEQFQQKIYHNKLSQKNEKRGKRNKIEIIQ